MGFFSSESEEKTTIPEATAEEKQLTQGLVEQAGFRFDEIKNLVAELKLQFPDIDKAVATLQGQTEKAIAQGGDAFAAFTQGIKDLEAFSDPETLQATDAELTNINDIIKSQFDLGSEQIQQGARQNLEQAREVFGQSRGLRPGDTPVLDRAAQIARTATEQTGLLSRNLAVTAAQQKQDVPFRRAQFQLGAKTTQLGFGESNRNFIRQLQEQGPQLSALPATLKAGLLNPTLGQLSSGESTLGVLGQLRAAQKTTTKSDTPSTFSSLLKVAGTIGAAYVTGGASLAVTGTGV